MIFGKIFDLTALLLKLGLRNPADLRHILGITLNTAREIEDSDADTRSLKAVSIDELVSRSGSDQELELRAFSGIPASVSPLEAYALAVLIKSVQARTAFEFGTYKGVSSTQLALNLLEPARLYTLDLPEDHGTTKLEITKAEERKIASEPAKGVLVPSGLRERVEFIREDSAVFDPAPFAGKMDLVFVDAAHNYDYVKNDSEKGWKMLRKGGVIIWHDCVPSHPDVVRFVKECGWSPERVAGTALAFAFKP